MSILVATHASTRGDVREPVNTRTGSGNTYQVTVLIDMLRAACPRLWVVLVNDSCADSSASLQYLSFHCFGQGDWEYEGRQSFDKACTAQANV